MTLGRSEVLDLLARHQLRPSRALGQNFVADANTVRRVARLAGIGPGDRVVEVGAGLGSLTLALAETGAEVTAIEVDAGLVSVLRSVAEPAGVRVVEADAMRLDWSALLGSGPASSGWVLVANLPVEACERMHLAVAQSLEELRRRKFVQASHTAGSEWAGQAPRTDWSLAHAGREYLVLNGLIE